jgi:hypothetical protein
MQLELLIIITHTGANFNLYVIAYDLINKIAGINR